MFYSQCLLSRKGPLGAIWVAAYFYKKLKKSQVTQTDITSSVDKILEAEFDAGTYRVLACLLLGVVRIYSKKVEYLFDDCNKALLMIKDFAATHRDNTLMETLCAPYFSVTLPATFELDAFDLGIVDDTIGRNVSPREEITLKDSAWKTGEMMQFFGQDDFDDVADCWNPCPSGYTFGEDVLAFHLIEFDMEVGTSGNAKDKLQENSYSDHEDPALETSSREELEPSVLIETFSQDHQTEGGHSKVPQAVSLDSMHIDDGFWHQAPLNFDSSSVVQEKPVNSIKSLHENCGADMKKLKDPIMVQSKGEMHQAFQEPCKHGDLEGMHQGAKTENNECELETSMEKLQDDQFFQTIDVEMPCAFEEPLQCGRPFDGGHQSDGKHSQHSDIALSARGKDQAVAGEHAKSITVDVTLKSKCPQSSGAATLDFLATPAAKECARTSSKRKCIVDDMIVFPNRVLKQHIENSSGLVCKRRKCPRTSLAAWKASWSSNLPKSFLEPLISCSSLELRSLFWMEKVKIPEYVETAKPMEESVLESPIIGKSVEIVEPREKLDMSGSPRVGRSVEELAERLDVLESSHVAMSVEIMEPSEKLNIPGSRDGGPLEEPLIAPETPIRHTTSLRSFESPERPEISISESTGPKYQNMGQEPSPREDQDVDLNFMNEEVNIGEKDDQDHSGWSERTRAVMRCLCRSFLDQKKRGEEEIATLLQLLEGRTRKESARFFHEILVLNTQGYLHARQKDAYDDILVRKTTQWDQALNADGCEKSMLQ